MRRCFFTILLLFFVFPGAFAYADTFGDNASSSIYAYFNITDDGEDSSLAYDRFAEQVEEIGIGNYTVLPISDLLAKEKQGDELSPNTIAITFDEPDDETYARAIPLLVQNKIPFTVFISPGNADETEWATLNDLQKNDFVTIGLTSFTYGHLGGWGEEKITEDLNHAKAIYRDHLGREPLFFAYPLGEYSAAFVAAVGKAGFQAAFGQNSGVLTQTLDPMKLPRFTMTDDYGDLERFRTTSNALPFPVKDMQPDTSYQTSMPAIGFTIDDRVPVEEMKKTKCFSSGTVQPETQFLNGGRIEVRFAENPVTDRLRINCTIPVQGDLPDDDPRYRWLGFLLYFPVKTTQVETDISPVQP